MKSHKILKKTLIAAAVVVALATAIFAGTQIISFSSHSDRSNDFTQLPAAQQLEKDYGFSPRTVESFTNGFQFSSGTPVSATATNEDGHDMASFQRLHLEYTRDGELLALNADASATLLPSPFAKVLELDGTTCYYSTMTNKFVPPDYQPTQEELDAADRGELNIGYGANEITTSTAQHLTWTQDGVNYTLYANDTTLTQDDMTAMALELMAQP